MRLNRHKYLLLILATSGLMWSCSSSVVETDTNQRCSSTVTTDTVPGVQKTFEKPTFWVESSLDDNRAVVMSAAEITALNDHTANNERGFRDVLNDAVASEKRTIRDLSDRAAWLRDKVASGTYVESKAGALELALTTIKAAYPVDQFRIIHREARLACVPMDEALYKPPIDPQFDRNRCSSLHAGEVLRVLRRWTPHTNTERGGWLYVHSGHSVGWVRTDAVTPPQSLIDVQRFLFAPSRIVATNDGAYLRLGRSAPLLDETADSWLVEWPTALGLQATSIPKSESVQRGYPPLTKAAVFNTALTQLGRPYGWGGYDGNRDCSRYIMDILGSFGLKLPRFSGYQAQSGTETHDVRGLSEREKVRLIQRLGKNAVVLLYMRGHIMLYLGFAEGRPWAISSISEYRRPCKDGKAQTVRLDRIAITDLELGRNTGRRAFIERIHTLTVFGT